MICKIIKNIFKVFFEEKKIVKLIEERVENVNKSSHFFYNRQNEVAQQKLSKNLISRKKNHQNYLT